MLADSSTNSVVLADGTTRNTSSIEAQNSLETIPWIVSFSAPDGETSQAGSTSWVAIRSNRAFDVKNSALTINGGGSEGILRSGVIDISSEPVSVALDLISKGNLEDNQDDVRFFCKDRRW